MMDSEKPKCFGKLPAYGQRAIACATCRFFDGCAWETIPNDLAKRGIPVERMKAVSDGQV